MENKRKFRPAHDLNLMDQVRQVLHYHHYAYQTEKTYCRWIEQYIRFHKCNKHPREMGKREIESFLSHLATDRKVSASTQRQALNAVVFLYKQVLDLPVAEDLEPVRVKRFVRPPVVMSNREVQSVLVQMQGIHLLMARMLYGCGLRLMECIRLRIKDLDFDRNLVYVCMAKGGKDRTTLFPKSIQEELCQQVERVRKIHEQDLVRVIFQSLYQENIPMLPGNFAGNISFLQKI